MVTSLSADQVRFGDGAVASGVDGGVFGSYYHRHIAIRLPRASPLVTEEATAQFLKEERDPIKQFQAAMVQLAELHELRHFHDCFGTVGGIWLFLNHLSMLRAFVAVCKRLFEDGLTWKLPVQDWLETPDCPDYVAEFLGDFLLNYQRRAAYEGALELPVQDTPDPRPWEDCQVENGPVFPAFPLHLARVVADLTKRKIESTVTTVHWIPLGFNALIEGNVQSMQGYWLDAAWPRHVRERFDAAQARRLSVFDGDDPPDLVEWARQMVEPYRITDLLMSKFLRLRHGIDRFPRIWIGELTDMALMRGYVGPFGDEGGHMLPGWTFTRLLEAAHPPGSTPLADGQPPREMKLWSSYNEMIRSMRRGRSARARNSGEASLGGTIPNLKDPDLAEFRKAVLALPPPEEVTHHHSFINTLEYIERYVRHRVIAPMLELRQIHGAAVFWNPTDYLRHWEAWPRPPMKIVGGCYLPRHDEDRRFPQWWAQYVMLDEIAKQICSGESVIHCPRAWPAITPGLATFDMAATPGCGHFIARRRCMTWNAGRRAPLPDCHFNTLTMAACLQALKVPPGAEKPRGFT